MCLQVTLAGLSFTSLGEAILVTESDPVCGVVEGAIRVLRVDDFLLLSPSDLLGGSEEADEA